MKKIMFVYSTLMWDAPVAWLYSVTKRTNKYTGETLSRWYQVIQCDKKNK